MLKKGSLTLKGFFFFTGRSKGKGKKEVSNGTSEKPFKRSLRAWLKRFIGLSCCPVVLFFSFFVCLVLILSLCEVFIQGLVPGEGGCRTSLP